MEDARFTKEWVEQVRDEWRLRPLTTEDLECYRVNYDIPAWAQSECRNCLPFGAALSVERLCCEVERLREALSDADMFQDHTRQVEAERDRYREALEQIDNIKGISAIGIGYETQKIARAALRGGEE